MRKIFSVPLNPKLNPEQYKTYCKFLLEHKDYIKDIYFTSRIPPFMQDAMGDVFVYKEDYNYANSVFSHAHTHTHTHAPKSQDTRSRPEPAARCGDRAGRGRVRAIVSRFWVAQTST